MSLHYAVKYLTHFNQLIACFAAPCINEQLDELGPIVSGPLAFTDSAA